MSINAAATRSAGDAASARAAAATYLALDLGAESGRAFLGRLEGGRLTIEEAHRFTNRPVQLPSGLHWDVVGLYKEVLEGIRVGANCSGGELNGIGVDAWGVDFGLLDGSGALIGIPFHYRDSRTVGQVERLCERLASEQLYSATGIQFLPINTLCQLLAMEGSRSLEAAELLLTIPDLMNYWLSGRAVSERTVASTTQMLGVDGKWAKALLRPLGIPTRILPPVIEAGSELAPVRAQLAGELGLETEVPIIAVGAHDTASAVVAVPALRSNFAYISSGTWSLVGLETQAPITSDAARELNLSNEAGVGGTVRLLSNVMGLWLLEECRRAWQREGLSYDYDELLRLAPGATGGPLIDPDDPRLLVPGDMPARLAALCRATGQAAPDGVAGVVRCILESLACKYRLVLERVESVAGRRAEVVHIVGGGARNAPLCQLTADVLGRPVLAGPIEATAIGNVMVQALAQGHVSSVEEIRRIVAASVRPAVHEPADERDDFERLYARFSEIAEGGSVRTARDPRPLTMAVQERQNT
jgi:rhamnulokinase